MKNYFTADGYQRWLNGHESAKRQAAPIESVAGEQSSSLLGKIRRWWQVEMSGQRRTKEEREKSSAEILW